ncbi:MAG: YbjP/YqhG family protein [Acidobacteria bacterium]|nr:YbjP/YqhG family protein [Acidobacteriota bacterium]
MKHLAFGLSFTLAIAVAAFPVNAQSASAPPKAARPPEVVVEGFYKWYIRSVSQNIDPFKKGKATLRKYVTLKLIREVEKTELDADYFLQSQEWHDEWEKSVLVSKPEVRGTTATAIVTFNAEGYPRVRVSLKQEGGVWKIDKVREARS